MKKKYLLAPLAMAWTLAAAASGGDTWRYTGTGYTASAFTNAVFWTDGDGKGNKGVNGATLNPEDYYLVENWKVLWTLVGQAANTTYTFGGKRLTLGETGTGKSPGFMEMRNYSTTTVVHIDDLVLENGWIKTRGYQTREHPLDGKITVTATSTNPFQLGANWQGGLSQTLTLRGELVGSSSAALRVVNRIVNGTSIDVSTNTTVKVSCDCSAYYGSITVTSALARTSSTFGTALSLGSVSMPGSVTVRENAILRTAGTANVAEIGTLTFEPGSCIALQTGTVGGHLTNGFFRVTNAFSAEGPVAVTIPSSIVPIDGTTIRLPVIEVPTAVSLSTNAFAVEFSDASTAKWPLEWLHFEIETEATCKRLVLVSEPVVYQTTNDYDSYSAGYASSLTNAERWSSGDVPREGTNYIVNGQYSKLLRTLSNTSLDYEFAGDSLTLYRYSSSKGASLFLFCHSFYVPLFCSISAQIAGGSSVPVAILRADKMQFVGTTNTVTAQVGGYVELNGPIYGSGVITMNGNNSYGSNGRVWLNGDNSNYKGKIRLSVGNATPNDTSIFQTLYVANGNNLGGARDSFAYDALRLEAYGLLCTTNGSVTLASGLNRGMYVNGVGRLRSEAGQTLSVNWPVTLNGTLRKEGAGNLLLGGEALFTPVDGVPAATPTADANIVAVKAGGIGVTAAESLDGMALQFAPGSKLVCCAGTEDADLAARGLVNTKAATPFAVVDGLEKIPVEIVSDAPPAGDNFTMAVATVPSAQAASLQGLLGWVKVPSVWKGYRASWTEPVVDAEAGTTTLKVKVCITGMRIIFR